MIRGVLRFVGAKAVATRGSKEPAFEICAGPVRCWVSLLVLGPGESLELPNAPHAPCQEGQPMQAGAAPVGAQAASEWPACSGASPGPEVVPAEGSSAPDGRPFEGDGDACAASVAATDPRDPAAPPGEPGLLALVGARQPAAPAGPQATLDQQICRAAALERILADQHTDSAPMPEASAGAAASTPAPALRGHVPGGTRAQARASEPGTGGVGASAMGGAAAAAGLVMVQLPRIRVRVPSAAPRAARAGTRGWRACFCAA